ncbi:MAG TPA: sigma-70 family RNA polymerase sigma factor, partial [Gemmata sp.]|nr:sigma-70 family RNA polymerase sigma factor [Gemmata sp.]
ATFLVLARKASSIVPRGSLANRLYGVARKASLKAREMNTRRQRREAQASGTFEPVSIAAIGPSQELRDLLDSELATLPDHYRSVIVLCDLEGRTRKEAARHLGCPEGSVSRRLSLARDMLARRLTRRGVVLTGGVLISRDNGLSSRVERIRLVLKLKTGKRKDWN